MRHNSLPLHDVELVEVHSISPEVSKCQVKVLYVGQEANRNGSIITEEFARNELANSVRGCPIVACYDNHKKDFLGHERDLIVEEGETKLVDGTRPYGFIDINAPVWFQTFEDDGVQHKYLMTEGYLWTGQYPETRKIIEEGRGQSMELNEDLSGSWTKDANGNPEFFIINEAIITKLCVLGEDVEPCFEGASITKIQYSLDENFKNEVYSFMEQMRAILRKGDTTMKDKELLDEVVEPVAEEVEQPVVEEQPVEEEAVVEEPAQEEELPVEEPVVEEPVVEESATEEEPAPEVKYNLDEVVEYAELSEKYAALETTYNSLNEKVSALENENAELKTFKLNVERKDKETMIAKFYMLSEEDKADVREHIDEYSLDEIESKLSVICVRNKVNFSLDNKEEQETTTVFNLNSVVETSNMPAWLKEVDDVAKNRK